MEEAGITFINGVEVGVDIDKATLESEYDAIIYVLVHKKVEITFRRTHG